MDKFGAFTDTDDCNNCKDNLVWSTPAKISIKPRDEVWTEMEKLEIVHLRKRMSIKEDYGINWNEKEITILETVNPELARYIFSEIISKNLNAQFTNGI